MLYDFRLRFNFAEGYRINSEEEKFEILTQPSGEHITLKSNATGKPIKDCTEVAIIGKSYTSENQAREAAEKSKRSLLYWATESRVGIDFGDGKPLSVVPREALEMMQKQSDYPVRNDIHGIDIYEHNEHTLFVKIDAKANVGKATQRLIDTFQREYANVRKISEKQLLACEIYVGSFFDISPRSRFITLVTAIEALLEPEKRSDEVLNIISNFIEEIHQSQLDGTTKNSIIGSLSRIQNESISQAGRALALRLLIDKSFNGQSSAEFFSYCYYKRSEILHNGTVSNKSVDIRQLANVTEEYVHELLLASLNS